MLIYDKTRHIIRTAYGVTKKHLEKLRQENRLITLFNFLSKTSSEYNLIFALHASELAHEDLCSSVRSQMADGMIKHLDKEFGVEDKIPEPGKE